MNKKLVAVAVAGMLAVPLAAQAQTANVTLYGRLNLDMEVINVKQDQPAANNPKENIYPRQLELVPVGRARVGSAGRRLERHIPDRIGGRCGERRRRSARSLGTRETFVGLQGGWGTFKAGYFLTPYDDIHPIFGNVPTLTTSILGTQALWSNTGWSGNSQYGGAFDDRAANSVRYDSPNIAGFTGSVQIGAGQTGGDATGSNNATPTTLEAQRKHAYMVSLNGLYSAGPFQAGVAYEFHNNFRPQGIGGDPKLQDRGRLGGGLLELRCRQDRGRIRAPEIRHRHGRRRGT